MSARSSLKSPFAVALFVFAAVNIALLLRNPIRFDIFAAPERSWTYWSLLNIRQMNSRPDIVLMGSSLMVTAISESDASFTRHTLDLGDYRGASYLSHQIASHLGGSYDILNLSAPGQIPSDAYLTLKAALKCGAKPKVVMYGIAPRDFIDGTMQNAYDSEAFHYLRRIVDCSEIAPQVFRSPLAMMDWHLQKAVYLYGKAPDLRLCVQNACEPRVARFFAFDPVHRPGAYARALVPGYKSFDLCLGSLIAQVPETDAHAHDFNDNTLDYIARYRRPDLAIYATQMSLVARLCQLCRENDIELVLVNMPITKRNVDLLPADIYQKYRRDLSDLAANEGITYLDQCRFEQYGQGDFRDSMHLNGFGGKKFVDKLVDAVSSHGELAKSLVAIGKRAETRALATSRASKPPSGLQ